MTRASLQSVADGDERALDELIKALKEGQRIASRFGQEKNPEFDIGMVQNIFNSKVKIGFVDLHFTDPKLQKHAIEKMLTGDVLSRLDPEKDFFQFVDEQRAWQEKVNEVDVSYREQRMVEDFGSEIERLCREYPSLQKKELLKVVMTLGAAHTRVARELEDKGYPAENKMSHGPDFTFGYGGELVRGLMFEKEVPDDLVAHSLLEGWLLQSFEESLAKHFQNDSYRKTLWARQAASRFSMGEVKMIYDIFREKDILLPDSFFAQSLKAKGIALPQEIVESEERKELRARYSKDIEKILNPKGYPPLQITRNAKGELWLPEMVRVEPSIPVGREDYHLALFKEYERTFGRGNAKIVTHDFENHDRPGLVKKYGRGFGDGYMKLRDGYDRMAMNGTREEVERFIEEIKEYRRLHQGLYEDVKE